MKTKHIIIGISFLLLIYIVVFIFSTVVVTSLSKFSELISPSAEYLGAVIVKVLGASDGILIK